MLNRLANEQRVFPGMSKVRRKLIVIGDGGCGKTSLLKAHRDGSFFEEYTPTIFENSTSCVKVDDKIVELSLWDTAGLYCLYNYIYNFRSGRL